MTVNTNDNHNTTAPQDSPQNQAEPKKPRLIEETDTGNNSSGVLPNTSTVSFAKYFSAVFSPLFMPTYCMAMAMWVTTLSIIDERTRFISSLMVLCITAAIPVAILLGLLRAGKISNIDISNRKQRFIPVAACGLCYLAAAIYVYRLHAPLWLSMMFVGAFIGAMICAIVSLWWKISAHGLGIGGLTGMLVRLEVMHICLVDMLPWISAIIILGGILGLCRVVLGAHNTLQFITGEILGALAVYTAMCMPLPFVQ